MRFIAMKVQANTIRPGHVIELGGKQWSVLKINILQPGKGGAFVQVEMRDVKSGVKSNDRFRTQETVEKLMVDEKTCTFLYRDETKLTMMDTENYEQFEMRLEELEWESKFLIEGVEGVRAFYYNGNPIGLELPQTVAMVVSETAPGVKGNSATGRTKAATLETGHVVQLPEHIDEGTKVSVDTRTGEFLGRAKD
jgi:elongation factor P